MQIIDNKALLLRTRSPEKYSIIPKSKVIQNLGDGMHEVAVHWGLDEARVLRNLGVKKVPSPINGRYNYPGRFKPFDHQRETAAFLTFNRRGFVFSEPGTGKTLSALWAADYLMELGEVRRCLILCPLSIMTSAWLQDLNNSIIHRSAIVAHHTQAARRVEMIRGGYEFVITNYDGLNLVGDEIIRDGTFDLIIVDEANAYKNVGTRRFKSLQRILTPKTLLWMMTGTPAAQSPLDAYGLAKLVNPEQVPRFFTGWRDKVMNKLTQFKWGAKITAAQDVFDALQPAIRFTKAECLDLPPVTTTTREVPLTPQQAKYYRMLKDQMDKNIVSAIDGNPQIVKMLETLDKTRGREHAAGAWRALQDQVREQTLKQLYTRRDAEGGRFNEDWVAGEAAKAAESIAGNYRTVIGDIDGLGRSPETDSEMEILKSKPEVAAPEFKKGMDRGDADRNVREFNVDALTRMSAEISAGGETKV